MMRTKGVSRTQNTVRRHAAEVESNVADANVSMEVPSYANSSHGVKISTRERSTLESAG